MQSRSRDLPPLVTKSSTSVSQPAQQPLAFPSNKNQFFQATVSTAQNAVVSQVFRDKGLRDLDGSIMTQKASIELTAFFNHLQTHFGYQTQAQCVLKVYHMLSKQQHIYLELRGIIFDLHQFDQMKNVKLDLNKFLEFAFDNPQNAVDKVQELVVLKNQSVMRGDLVANTKAFCQHLNTTVLMQERAVSLNQDKAISNNP